MTTSTFAKQLSFMLALVLGLGFAQAQTPREVGVKHITYTFVDGSGTNASAVVWIPDANAYVTCIAGNPTFPLEAFSVKGQHLWSQEVGVDARGLWYNAKKKVLVANLAGEEGWYSTSLDAKGQPAGDWEMIRDGMMQPDFQSVLTSTGKQVFGYYNGEFYIYKARNGKYSKSVPLGEYESSDWQLNSTTVAYTGVKEYPLAVLDYSGGNVLFFSLGGGYLASTSLPEGAVLPEMFRFSFANKMIWLYDADMRTWTSYRVFE